MSNNAIFKDYLYTQFKNFYTDVLTQKFTPLTYDNSTSGMSATTFQGALDELAQNFQDGCDTIMQALAALHLSPASNSPTDIANTILSIQPYFGSQPQYRFDYMEGYVQNGSWHWEAFNNTYLDIYEVQANHNYTIALGGVVGTRFRVMLTETDVTTIHSSQIVTGTSVQNTNDPVRCAYKAFTSTIDGYLIVAKDNAGVAGLRTYLMDKTV